MQYEETDWEFSKTGLTFSYGLVNDVHINCPRCYFETDNGKLNLETVNYVVKQDIGKYLKLSNSGISGLSEQEFIYYEVETYSPADIGDGLQFQGQTLYVYQIMARMEKGIFVYHLDINNLKRNESASPME